MAGKEYSSYQRDVISRYYDNLNAITLDRLQELATVRDLNQNEYRLRIELNGLVIYEQIPDKAAMYVAWAPTQGDPIQDPLSPEYPVTKGQGDFYVSTHVPKPKELLILPKSKISK